LTIFSVILEVRDWKQTADEINYEDTYAGAGVRGTAEVQRAAGEMAVVRRRQVHRCGRHHQGPTGTRHATERTRRKRSPSGV